jgi:hypothetical protein
MRFAPRLLSASAAGQVRTPTSTSTSTSARPWVRLRASVVACLVAGVTALTGAATLAPSPANASSPSWKITAAPVPAGAVTSSLVSVACPTAKNCVAIGDTTGKKASPCSCLGFSEVLSDGKWTVQPFAADDPMLAGAVSCTSSTFCVAVGTTPWSVRKTHAVAQVWNGHVWKAMQLPSGSWSLSSVTCLSTRWCMAVGTTTPQSARTQCCALVAIWDGHRWAGQRLSTPAKSDFDNSVLLTVSCASPQFCAAGGEDDVQRGELWFFDGQHWTLRYAGQAAATRVGRIMSVSCPSVAGCVVAGDLDSGMAFVTPHRWTAAKTPGYAQGYVPSVSCTAASRCTAVGAIGYPARGFVLSWNGRTWTTEHTPSPAPSSLSSVLLSAACPTASRCVGVGLVTNSQETNDHLLIETRG